MLRSLSASLGLVSVIFVLACGESSDPSPKAARVEGAAATRAPTGSDIVSNLNDLIGVRASAAETQMQARGYSAVGGHTEANAAVTFWRRDSDGSCVSVRTSDGRYQIIAPATRLDCERAETATQVVAEPDPGGYRTVCGVMVDGKPIRYVCSVLDGDQHRTPTTLRFPDMVMVLHWQGGNRVRVELEGTVPMDGTWSEYEGETDIVTSEKTWFYISNREMAAWEVQQMAP